jgi:hypothetical protein
MIAPDPVAGLTFTEFGPVARKQLLGCAGTVIGLVSKDPE